MPGCGGSWAINPRLFSEKQIRLGHLAGEKQGVLTENLWPKLFSEAPRCAPLRLFLLLATRGPSVSD